MQDRVKEISLLIEEYLFHEKCLHAGQIWATVALHREKAQDCLFEIQTALGSEFEAVVSRYAQNKTAGKKFIRGVLEG